MELLFAKGVSSICQQGSVPRAWEFHFLACKDSLQEVC